MYWINCGRRLVNLGANIDALDRRKFSTVYWSTRYLLPLLGKIILMETNRRALGASESGDGGDGDGGDPPSGWHDFSPHLLELYAADMSFGIEPFPVVLDLRPPGSGYGADRGFLGDGDCMDQVRRDRLSPAQYAEYTDFAFLAALSRDGLSGALRKAKKGRGKKANGAAVSNNVSNWSDPATLESVPEVGSDAGSGDTSSNSADSSMEIFPPCGKSSGTGTLSPYMSELCSANSPLIPRFVYSMTVVNAEDFSSAAVKAASSSALSLSAGVSSVADATGSKGCVGCKCVGDCRLSSHCPCIAK